MYQTTSKRNKWFPTRQINFPLYLTFPVDMYYSQITQCDWGWGCPVYPLEFLVRVCHPVPQILTQFQTKACHFFHSHSQARALKSIPVFRSGPWVIAFREMTVNERFQFQHLFASDMCCSTRETCAPLPWKHISLVICVPLPRKNISLVIWVPLQRKHNHITSVPLPGKHIFLNICVPLPMKHISLVIDMCYPTQEPHIPSNMYSPTREHISLVIHVCVPLPKKHIFIPTDTAVCVPLPLKHISLVICVPLARKHIFLHVV